LIEGYFYTIRQLNDKGKMMNDTKNFNELHKNGLDITHLRARLKGKVIGPQDEEYTQACTVFYGGISRRPAVIIRVAGDEDVRRVVELANQTGIELAVRSGGHSIAGHSLSNGGIVLNLGDMRGLKIDRKKHTAWAETGLTAGEYTLAADSLDLATGFGDTATVGIGGITLGGGIGYLSRKQGLTIDHLLAADIVTADGQLKRVDAENHPDLFWAIRGGGGNFGVVTRFQFRLYRTGKVFGGMLILPATPKTISGFIAETQSAPDELSTIANIMPAPPMPFLSPEHHGKLVILAMMVYAGDPDKGMSVAAPFRKLAQPLADMLRPMRYPEIYPPEDPGYHPTAVGHTMFLERIEIDTAKTIINYLQASDAPVRVIQLRAMGGAIERIQTDATAFSHRSRKIMANLAAFYSTPNERVLRNQWLKEFSDSLQQEENAAYVNFLGDEGEERIRAAYPGKTWERLKEIKARYDPTNLFRLNQNIPPASESMKGD
jgi:hypothetical protein